MKYGILPKLTKNYIMQYINQEDIFAYYMAIDVGTILNCINTGNHICNPMRVDNNPSLGFKYGGNRLRAKDFSGYFWGDCYDLVAQILRVDSRSKSGFGIILDQIAKDFSLHRYKNTIAQKTKIQYNIKKEKKENKKSVIKFTVRKWNKIDYDYWMGYGVSIKALKYFNVYPASEVWVNGVLRYEYNPTNPAYVYYYGKDENGIDEVKVYYPFRSRVRFITNSSRLQGINKIIPDRVCVITKSYKDVISLRTTISLQAVAPASETHLIDEEDYKYLTTQFDYIFSLMDYDRTGKLMAKKLRELHGIQPLFVNQDPKGKQLNHTSKDYTDLFKDKGLNYTKNLVTSTVQHYEEQLENFKLIHKDYDKFY